MYLRLLCLQRAHLARRSNQGCTRIQFSVLFLCSVFSFLSQTTVPGAYYYAWHISWGGHMFSIEILVISIFKFIFGSLSFFIMEKAASVFRTYVRYRFRKNLGSSSTK